MSIKLLLEGTTELAKGIWTTRIRPHEIPMFGQPKTTIGSRSVLLAENVSFDKESGHLQLDAASLIVLNLGNSTEAIVLNSMTGAATLAQVVIDHPPDSQTSYEVGPGDREFLRLVERELRGEAKEAAKLVHSEVRRRFPGDLQRGQRLNFKNAPDNFWYVIVQPRAQSLSITVRGSPDRFKSSALELKDDRPGYTRFKVENRSEVQDAVRVIEQSKRK